MSHSGSESDIWDYKPLKKSRRKSNNSTEQDPKRRTGRRVKVEVNGAPKDQNRDFDGAKQQTSRVTCTDADAEGFCPVCQMPFAILVVQSQQWHVAECLDAPGEDSRECPDGVQCTSSIPSHYKRYSHSLLAHSRALNNNSATTQSRTVKASLDLRSVSDVAHASSTECSVDSSLNISNLSSQSSSPCGGLMGTPTKTNALLLLRSPNTEDIKKKKGWLSSTKRSQSQGSSQEAKSSTPVKERPEIKEELPAFNDDDYISYSPLSEHPDISEAYTTQRTNNETVRDEREGEVDDESLKLFSDEDDELFMNTLDQYDTNSQEHGPQDSLDTCVKSQDLLTADGPITSSFTCVSDGKSKHGPLSQLVEKPSANGKYRDPQLQSPQSLVLERLRECISSPARINSLAPEAASANINQDLIPTQTVLSITQKTSSMGPRRTQTKGGPSGFKQTDIGVFFGLKPLTQYKSEEGVDGEEVVQEGSRNGRTGQNAKQTGGLRRKNEVSDISPAEDGTAQPTQTGGRKRRAAGWNRWNRERTTDGDPEVHRRCPFYKKIPGTGFAVDAFQYGLVEGVTAYFLTHFHSDHYIGLKKDSVFPIYCNKVTSNLVKSKLKVDEQYVHVLPMNEQYMVQGVKVTLLDANHCPGAAMLLFVLPDGQTVLHTGDFRADPSMERYPELEGLRIQSLYLDTTYCSPEYTFPTQQEVITFAVNTAFEWVTLNPRTLIVCGSYAVGKEKVFLAVSEVLGSKVCLSRDKYKTMFCLESEQIDQRITTDWQRAQVHVLPMMQLNFKNLRTHLKKFSGKYDQLLAFKPTGWTFNQTVRVEDIQPQTQGNISIYGIPYSEHSSYLEMKRFVQWLRPKKIIPTVNVGSWKSRKAMESYFHDWQTEQRNI